MPLICGTYLICVRFLLQHLTKYRMARNLMLAICANSVHRSGSYYKANIFNGSYFLNLKDEYTSVTTMDLKWLSIKILLYRTFSLHVTIALSTQQIQNYLMNLKRLPSYQKGNALLKLRGSIFNLWNHRHLCVRGRWKVAHRTSL